MSSGRGMYEEKHTRTWEILLVPDSKDWNEVSVSLGRKDGIRRPSNSKIPALMRRVPAHQRARNGTQTQKTGSTRGNIR